jgi:hypothetical protein
MSRLALRLILSAAVLATLVALSYQLRPAVLPAFDCDLNLGPCRAPLDGGELTLSLSPRPIPLLTPITVEVRLASANADAVRFELIGAEMDMGLNRSKLTAAGDGRFTGSTTIPVCITGRMRWLAVVSVDARGKTSARSFAFEMPYRAPDPATGRS